MSASNTIKDSNTITDDGNRIDTISEDMIPKNTENPNDYIEVFQIIVKSAIFEFLYKPKVSTKIIIKEYLDASNFFLEDSQTKYLNAILDKIAKKIRTTNA